MAATSPYPINSTNSEYFSAKEGDLYNQGFIDTVAKDYQTKDPVIRNSIHTALGISCKPLAFLQSYIGFDEYCPERNDDTWSVARYFPTSRVLPYTATTSTTLAVGASVTLTMPANRQYPLLGNIMPRPNEYVLIADTAYLKVTAVSYTLGTPTITVQNVTDNSVTISATGNFISISGINPAKCTCPSQQVGLPVKPLLEDYTFWRHFKKFELCNEDLEKCLRFEYNYKLWNEKTEQFDVITNLGSQILRTEMANYEIDKEYKLMYHNEGGEKGIEPQLRDKAIRWDLANAGEITDADMDTLDDLITEKGFKVKEFVVFAEKVLYRAAQKYMRDTAQGKFVFGCFDVEEMCKTVSIDLCAIERNGIKIKFILDECRSSGLGVGALTSATLKNKGIGMPMANMGGNGSTRRGSTNKVATIVYKSTQQGLVYNSLHDSTGRHGMRMIQESGCEINTFSHDSRMAVEIQDPYNWLMINY